MCMELFLDPAFSHVFLGVKLEYDKFLHKFKRDRISVMEARILVYPSRLHCPTLIKVLCVLSIERIFGCFDRDFR
jgi:hypothetical protein